ncbi:MAG: hypothetical protein RJA25_759 [Bacteroidota bacterium]
MNTLYPIFLKTENFNILIIGGGKVALEKITFLLKSSPNASVTIVANEFSEEIKTFVSKYISINILEKKFEEVDVENKQLVIAATNDKELNEQIYQVAKQKNILINVADTPELCDFYMGSIVTKGDLKIAISTNGKSPTLSKRLREFFETILPDDLQELIDNLHQYRNTLKGDFEKKVKTLNELTKSFSKKS